MGSIHISSSLEEGPDPEVAELSASTVVSNHSQLLLGARLAQGRGSSSLWFCSLAELQPRAAARAQVSPPSVWNSCLPIQERAWDRNTAPGGRVTECVNETFHLCCSRHMTGQQCSWASAEKKGYVVSEDPPLKPHKSKQQQLSVQLIPLPLYLGTALQQQGHLSAWTASPIPAQGPPAASRKR